MGVIANKVNPKVKVGHARKTKQEDREALRKDPNVKKFIKKFSEMTICTGTSKEENCKKVKETERVKNWAYKGNQDGGQNCELSYLSSNFSYAL